MDVSKNGQKCFAQNQPKYFYYVMWAWGTNFMKWNALTYVCSKRMELMKQIHLFKKGFVIFLKGATFSDFIETRLSNYKPLAIRIAILEDFFSIRFKPHQVVDLLSCTIPKKELSQISRTTRQKMIKICENLMQDNTNNYERFHGKRTNISARYLKPLKYILS